MESSYEQSFTIRFKDDIEEWQNALEISPVEQYRQLTSSVTPEGKARYKAICDQRDAVLTGAVLSAAKHLLADSQYNPDTQLTPNQNNQAAIKSLEEYLANSSISELDQYLLALAGTGALYGWSFRQTLEEEGPPIFEFYRADTKEIDPVIIHRLAKALDRSQNYTIVFQSFIKDELFKLPPQDVDLVAVAIQMFLSGTLVSELDEDFRKIVRDSILGG